MPGKAGTCKVRQAPALPAYRQVVRAIGRLPASSLSAETVELSVSHTAEKCVPFIRGEPEDRTAAVPAIAYADLTGGEARLLDAVAVGEAQRALSPVSSRILPFGRIFPRRYSHRYYLTDWVCYPECALRNVGGDSPTVCAKFRA